MCKKKRPGYLFLFGITKKISQTLKPQLFSSPDPISHWTYCLYFHSNYCTHSLYHFEKPAIVATKSYIFIFMHVKPIKVTSGFNLRVMKKIRQVALSYRKIKNKYEKADISTIDADPGVPRVSKDAPGST